MTSSLAIFRDRAYLRVWWIGALTGIVRWLELLAFGIYALDLTGSAGMVAVIALLRFLPLAVLSIFIGALGDHGSPRTYLIWAIAGGVVVSAAMLGISLADGLTYSLLCVAALASGTLWACDMPLRRKIIGEIAGPQRLASAMAYDYATSHGTRMIGPLAGGVLYQAVGMDGVFGLVTVLLFISLWLTWSIEPDTPSGEPGAFLRLGNTLRGSVEAFRAARKSNDVSSILAVTVVFNVWGFPFVSMIPVIGRDELSLSPSVIGLVASIEGLASMIGILLIASRAREGRLRLFYFVGMASIVASVGLIGAFPGLLTMSAALVLAGFSMSAFAATQSTLIYLVAPPEMRGRFLGLMSICIGAGLLGFANVGWTADVFGASTALWIIAAEGAIPALVLGLLWRSFRQELRHVLGRT